MHTKVEIYLYLIPFVRSDGQGVIELVASKVMDGASICEISLDRELSNRVKNSGRIDANPNDLVSRWLNSIKSDSLHSVKLKKSHKYQTVSSHESIENGKFTY